MIKVHFFLAAVFLAVSFGSVPGRAQLPMAEGPTKERSQSDGERDLEERIANMRYLAALAERRGASRKKDPELAAEELQEDFVRLQVLNKNLVLTVAKSPKVDLKFVRKSASEINRRAERLMSNLALPEAGPGVTAPTVNPISEEKQLRSAITSLGSRIYWFTKNPIFKEVTVIEPQAAGKASADLKRIIELSALIRESSDKSGK